MDKYCPFIVFGSGWKCIDHTDEILISYIEGSDTVTLRQCGEVVMTFTLDGWFRFCTLIDAWGGWTRLYGQPDGKPDGQPGEEPPTTNRGFHIDKSPGSVNAHREGKHNGR